MWVSGVVEKYRVGDMAMRYALVYGSAKMKMHAQRCLDAHARFMCQLVVYAGCSCTA